MPGQRDEIEKRFQRISAEDHALVIYLQFDVVNFRLL